MSVTLALLLLLPLPVQESDAAIKYREDFATYTTISEMTDPVEQTAAYLDFFEAGPHPDLIEFVRGGILQGLGAMTQAGAFDDVYPMADRLAELHPESAATAGALALDAAAMAGNAEQIVKYGEPYYAASPSPQIALLLTQSFSQLQEQEKMREYGQVVLDSGEYPIADVWAIAFEILQDHEASGRSDQAIELAREFRSAVTTAPAGVAADDWDGIQVYVLGLIGRDDFDAGRYGPAITSFDGIIDLRPRNQGAWYFKGNAMLQNGGSVDAATDALATAAVLEGNYSTPAMDLLQSTYASNAPGETAARYVQEKLTAARGRLGL
jgi:Flp pilus assembly protein TadD